jgi:hypothetical protein
VAQVKQRDPSLLIATYNVNGSTVGCRASRMAGGDENPMSSACRSSRRTTRSFLQGARGGRLRSDLARPACSSRRRHPRQRRKARRVASGLPEAGADSQTRYLEAETKGIVVASIYCQWQSGTSPNFDYNSLVRAADPLHGKLCASEKPVLLAGDLNVVPTDFDIYNPGGGDSTR